MSVQKRHNVAVDRARRLETTIAVPMKLRSEQSTLRPDELFDGAPRFQAVRRSNESFNDGLRDFVIVKGFRESWQRRIVCAITVGNAQRAGQLFSLFENINVGSAVIVVKAVAERTKVVWNTRVPIDTRLALKFIRLKFGCFNFELRFATVTRRVFVCSNIFDSCDDGVYVSHNVRIISGTRCTHDDYSLVLEGTIERPELSRAAKRRRLE